MTPEAFIAQAIAAARAGAPEAGQYFKAAQQMSSDPKAPDQFKRLGKVLQLVLMGEANVDLSSLPDSWAEAVRKALE